MRKFIALSALTLTLALSACTQMPADTSSPGVVIGDGTSTIVPKPVMPVPVQPAPTTGPQVTTTTGILVDFLPAATVVTNYTGEMQRVCLNAQCTGLPAGYVTTTNVGAAAVQKLSVYGAELTFNANGSYMRPTSEALITTRRITTHHGNPIFVGDNIPGLGEAWTDRAGEITQLVVEHLE
ncbi:hypothetical protein ACFOPQ_01165 [Deinococcus antarcticus]|uniref:Lipoprotein n=1 Tax=Deinococcus antarcticus TaxID=1298767 RepID=A0ABV8A1R6_9DEIO